jgi:hypothetical protein
MSGEHVVLRRTFYPLSVPVISGDLRLKIRCWKDQRGKNKSLSYLSLERLPESTPVRRPGITVSPRVGRAHLLGTRDISAFPGWVASAPSNQHYAQNARVEIRVFMEGGNLRYSPSQPKWLLRSTNTAKFIGDPRRSHEV